MGSKNKTTRYVPPAAQVVMRREMEEPKVVSKASKVIGDILDADLASVLEDIVGPAEEVPSEISRYGEQQRRATQIVYDIINQHNLVLALSQWQVVQTMMEQAVMTGVQLERDS